MFMLMGVIYLVVLQVFNYFFVVGEIFSIFLISQVACYSMGYGIVLFFFIFFML